MTARLRPAPEFVISEWLNAAEPVSLDRLRGRVVMIEAFQMLCPGCVSQGLPQAQRVRETFREAGELGQARRAEIVLGLDELFSTVETTREGLWMDSSSWLITARAPDA